ncbi:hypothetical protein CCH79_00007032, partial [Gambusia affinis]
GSSSSSSSSSRVLFLPVLRSCRRRFGVVLLHILEPNGGAVQSPGEQDGAVAAAEGVGAGAVMVAVAGVSGRKRRRGVAGSVYAQIRSGGQRGAAVPLGQQIRSSEDGKNMTGDGYLHQNPPNPNGISKGIKRNGCRLVYVFRMGHAEGPVKEKDS